jgi:hypothetical protein
MGARVRNGDRKHADHDLRSSFITLRSTQHLKLYKKYFRVETELLGKNAAIDFLVSAEMVQASSCLSLT